MALSAPQTDTDRLLAEAEINAEKLVSVLRMIVAAGLMAFFAVTVGPFSGDADAMQLRQWGFATGTMTVYFLVGFVSWRLGCRGLLRRWMIWVTVTSDCLLLLVNIWLSLENTGLPGQTVFVLPSVWLAPIALAFGMLRVDPAVQVYTAIWVVVGLALLIGLDTRPVPEVLDGGDRVAFFLAGPPNIMRLTMIALAGGVLVIAARRTRALLLRSITETQARANLTRYLPAQMAGELAEAQIDDLRRGRREEMAIIFVDIRGFTGLSEAMAPDEVSSFVSEFRHRLSRVVNDTGGMVDKFMGDAAMILFRADGNAEQAARNALTCADALRQEMARWSEARVAQGDAPVRVGIGAHWGEVFSGVVGDDARLEYSVFGDTVNVAARLEAMTKTLDAPIVVSRDLLDRAGGNAPGRWHLHGRTGIRGRGEEVEVLACTTG